MQRKEYLKHLRLARSCLWGGVGCHNSCWDRYVVGISLKPRILSGTLHTEDYETSMPFECIMLLVLVKSMEQSLLVADISEVNDLARKRYIIIADPCMTDLYFDAFQ